MRYNLKIAIKRKVGIISYFIILKGILVFWFKPKHLIKYLFRQIGSNSYNCLIFGDFEFIKTKNNAAKLQIFQLVTFDSFHCQKLRLYF
jgi:hypothetical protein